MTLIQYLNNIDLQVYNDSPIILENAGHYLQFDQPEKMNALYFAFKSIAILLTFSIVP